MVLAVIVALGATLVVIETVAMVGLSRDHHRAPAFVPATPPVKAQ